MTVELVYFLLGLAGLVVLFLFWALIVSSEHRQENEPDEDGIQEDVGFSERFTRSDKIDHDTY